MTIEDKINRLKLEGHLTALAGNIDDDADAICEVMAIMSERNGRGNPTLVDASLMTLLSLVVLKVMRSTPQSRRKRALAKLTAMVNGAFDEEERQKNAAQKRRKPRDNQ